MVRLLRGFGECSIVDGDVVDCGGLAALWVEVVEVVGSAAVEVFRVGRQLADVGRRCGAVAEPPDENGR